MRSRGNPRSTGDKAQRAVAFLALGFLSGMALVSVILAGSVADDNLARSSGVGLTAFLLFTASASVGAALGFMFGLPRARFAERLSAGELDQAAAASVASPSPSPSPSSASTHYLANSNLIKVSDWLSTIIIGLGLVNLGGFLPAMGSVAVALREPLGGMSYSGVVGVSILVAGALIGFLLVYLWTALRVRELMEDSERQFELKGVPALTGLTVRQAREALGATSLELVQDLDAVDDATILTQSLQPGAIVPRGSQVVVTAALADPRADELTPVTPEPALAT
jgi:hypothetical protein